MSPAVWAAAAVPSDAPIFNAVLSLGSESRFILISPGGKSSGWIKLNDSFSDYTLKSYDAKESALELEGAGKSFKIHLDSGRGTLQGSVGSGTAGTLESANELMKVMRFDDLMAKMIDQQKKALANTLRTQLEPLMRMSNFSEEEKKGYFEAQEKAFGDMLGAILDQDFKDRMAKAYSEAFTQEELNAQASFYATPAGRALVDRTPEVQAKLNEAIQPKIMNGVGALMGSMTEYMKEVRRKRAAAAAVPTTEAR